MENSSPSLQFVYVNIKTSSSKEEEEIISEIALLSHNAELLLINEVNCKPLKDSLQRVEEWISKNIESPLFIFVGEEIMKKVLPKECQSHNIAFPSFLR
jgi:hypothetical protein